MARTVVITGCSDGGLGAALAVAFHKQGDRVIATARNPSKMASLKAAGIETLTLDVLSDESVSAAAEQVAKLTGGSLDILLNNAGTGYSTPLLDAEISEVAKLFELNTFAFLRVTQRFFPLLRKASNGAMVVNNTSVASVMPIPFQGPYCATKAAEASLSESLRLELQPFDIKVIDLKTGTVKSNFFSNTTSSGSAEGGSITLPEDSLYSPAREKVEKFMRTEIDISQMPADQWASAVVKDLSKTKPPIHVWQGSQVFQVWIGTLFPVGFSDGWINKLTGLDLVIKYWKGAKEGKKK